ncbi:MAG: hypothetical protein P9L94_02505 [Candidatus Hinthialibacter antarcticus]|nr:hypothetical protein [Candidatus Hinthialibacter antarcticus]
MRRPRYGSQSLTYFAIGLVIGVAAALVFRTIYHAANIPEARRLFPDTAPQYLEETGNPLDLAINGPGFFAFEDENGNWVFSRESGFVINKDGKLASEHGYQLVSRGTIRPALVGSVAAKPKIGSKYNPEDIHIDNSGMAWIIHPASKIAQPLRNIPLYRFPSQKNYVWGGEHFWFGRPPGETPIEISAALSPVEPMIWQGYRLRSGPPPGEKNPFNVNGPYHNGPKNILGENLIKTDRELDYGISGDAFVAVNLAAERLTPARTPVSNFVGFTRWVSLDEDKNGKLERKFSGRLLSSQTPLKPMQRLHLTENVPLITKIEIESIARSNQTSSMEPPDGFIAPTLGVPTLDADLYNEKFGEEPFRLVAREGEVDANTIDEIELYRFANPQNLHYIRSGVYTANDLSGPPIAVPKDESRGMLKQGYLNDVERLKP